MPIEDQIDDLVESFDARFQEAMRDIIKRLQEKLTHEQLVFLLESGDIAAIEEAYRDTFDVINSGLTPVFEEESLSAGLFLIGLIPAAFGSPSFSLTRPETASVIRDTQMRMVDSMTQTTLQGIRLMARQPTTDYEGQARRFIAGVGLSDRNAQAIINYENALRNNSSVAIRRALRDKKFDERVLRAIRGGSPLSEDQIQMMVSRYREKMTEHRIKLIAFNEKWAAFNAGYDAALNQAIDEGFIEEGGIRRFWIHRGDSNVRAAHMAIPRNNPKGVGPKQAFTSPLGPIRFPHDPQASLSNTAGCRCIIQVKFVEPS